MQDDICTISYIMKLQKQSERELRTIWRIMFDNEPEIISRKYMIGRLAHKIQELAHGNGIDPEIENKIKACAKKLTREKTIASKKEHKFNPIAGAKIVKEYKGNVYEIMVVEDGFSYAGIVYKSLSAIATKITGTKWNGLKFFGVKA